MGALEGVRVLELGQLIAGPFCGQLLGDMGAEVIKVEPPGAGDPMRQWGRGDAKLWWEIIARNKKSISIDLRTAAGQELTRQLAARADILIENFRPGTLEKWNLAPSSLQALNPGLIVVRISGYGQTGPYASRPGFGGIAEAMGGWRYIVGEPDRPPARMGIAIGDSLAATYACMGALAALYARQGSGRGQIVDVALYEAVLQVMESLISEYDYSNYMRERSGSILPEVAPSNIYPCIDGDLMIGANKDSLFRRLAVAMDRAELAEDVRYSNHLARGKHQAELDELIAQWTKLHTVAHVEEVMMNAGVPCGKIYRPPDMISDPHFMSRGAIVDVETERWGTIKMQGCFPALSETPSKIRFQAPATVGQDTSEILRKVLGQI